MLIFLKKKNNFPPKIILQEIIPLPLHIKIRLKSLLIIVVYSYYYIILLDETNFRSNIILKTQIKLSPKKEIQGEFRPNVFSLGAETLFSEKKHHLSLKATISNEYIAHNNCNFSFFQVFLLFII